jgi:hypothetical protein
VLDDGDECLEWGWIHVIISVESCALGDRHSVNTSDLFNLSEVYTRGYYFVEYGLPDMYSRTVYHCFLKGRIA